MNGTAWLAVGILFAAWLVDQYTIRKLKQAAKSWETSADEWRRAANNWERVAEARAHVNRPWAS